MSPRTRYAIEWPTPDGVLRAYQPEDETILALAPLLAAAYNDDHNAPMMGHAAAMDVEDVIDSYRGMIEDGDALFVLELDGEFVGDGDLRDAEDGCAELAIMLATRTTQGRGLGTRFAIMLHAFGFGPLGLDRIYVGIVPANVASQKLFARIGHDIDDSPTAREYADAPEEITMSIGKAEFHARHAEAIAHLRFTEIS
jgi:RimJ/RimL family protein N-acetyltransferase